MEARCAALFYRSQSPMITVSGTAAEGPPAAHEIRRRAVRSASPQLIAVMGTDMGKRLAVIPVIYALICDYFESTKVIIIFIRQAENI